MARPESCQRSKINTCSGCYVEEIAVESLINAQPIERTVDVLMAIADNHCPEGLAPEGIVLPSDIHLRRNGKSRANNQVSECEEVRA